MLTPQQVKEFNELFVQKNVVQDEPLFNSWLPLKMSTIPIESESIKRILSDHTYSNVPKKKQAGQQNLPKGKDRFDPISKAWVEVLEEQENKKKKSPPKPPKSPHKPPKKKPTQSKQPAKTKINKKTLRV